MKRTLIALALAFCLLLGCAPVASAALAPEVQRDLVYELLEFLNASALEGAEDDDPLYQALLSLFERDPYAYELLVDAILSQYDEHTMYIPAGVYDAAFPASSQYVGVGVTIRAHERGALVDEANTVGPAYLAGIRAGDVLTAIDGTSLAGLTLDEVSALLRGEKDTWVRVTVARGEQTLSFTILRVAIGDANFTGYLLEEGVYYMQWTRLSTTESFIDFIFAVQDMCRLGARSLILDLRGNPGGGLDLGFSVVDRLLPDAVDYFRIGYREGEGMGYDVMTSSGQGPRLNQIVVLVDSNSASASEIVLCGLCDTGYAVSVGETTYGKARAQYHVTFEDNSAFVITTYQLASMTRPDYEGVGITPDYFIVNEYGAHPAASCAPVPEQALAFGGCSDNVTALNAALQALGYLGRQERPYYFSGETQLALQRLSYDHGLTPAVSGMSAAQAALINRCLEEAELTGFGVIDWQMEKALELAREAAKQPAQYHLDELGNLVNDSKQ